MSATDTVLLAVRDLVRAYGERRVLDGLSFDLHRGECLVILGRSGCGKSVTLRQLNGLEEPNSGSVRFDGEEISHLPEADLTDVRRRVAMLFQSGALFDSMNVFDNVAFPLREHRDWDETRIAEEVHRKLALVQLVDIDERMPSALSGGMRKRVALARSLALDPEVMLYDEPTSGLDPITSAVIGRLMVRAQEKLGMTSVVVTHDLPLARAVADRVGFLDGGRFRFLGSWQAAEAAADPLLAAFLAGKPLDEEGGEEGDAAGDDDEEVTHAAQ
jgi:phospholipid/cholesterol/gamma-HCH transport system ATP-binding protein